MADTAAEPKTGGGSSFGFLGKKLFGKVPVWVLAVAAVGGYYWYTRYGPGKSSTTSSAAQTTGTDPAGNTGIIDPATGYVYGSSEDSAALAAAGNTGGSDLTGAQGPAGPPGPRGPAGPPPPIHGPINKPPVRKPPKPRPRKPPTKKPPVRRPGGGPPRGPVTGQPGQSGPPAARSNEEWQGSAVSNLISQGVPPDQASTAIQAHLNGQPLSPVMAANRDLAIESIGPNPQVPEPGQMQAPTTAGSGNA